MQWIINKREDLIWLIGSSLLSFILAAAYFILTGCFNVSTSLASIILVIFWSIGFDISHLFASYTRTYFDPIYFRANRFELIGVLLVLLVGPIYLLIAYRLHDLDSIRALITVLTYFTLSFAYYHLIKQHWGFISLYRTKNGETNPITRKLDALILVSGLMYPYIKYYLFSYTPITSTKILPVEVWQLLVSNLFIGGGSCIILTASCQFFPKFRSSISKFMLYMAIICCSIGAAIIIARNCDLQKFMNIAATICVVIFCISIATALMFLLKSRTINYPKWLLMIVVIATHNIIYSLPLTLPLVYACVTIFHNMQYHRIVYFVNQAKYLDSLTKIAKTQFGFAAKIVSSLSLYSGLTILFSLTMGGIVYITSLLVKQEIYIYLVLMLFWGMAWHHYILDSMIWHHRHDKELKTVFT